MTTQLSDSLQQFIFCAHESGSQDHPCKVLTFEISGLILNQNSKTLRDKCAWPYNVSNLGVSGGDSPLDRLQPLSSLTGHTSTSPGRLNGLLWGQVSSTGPPGRRPQTHTGSFFPSAFPVTSRSRRPDSLSPRTMLCFFFHGCRLSSLTPSVARL